jgi:hypothetical protein
MTSLRTTLVVLAVAVVAAGCGSQDTTKPKGPLGSPDNPVPARAEAESSAGSEGGAATKPGYAKLLERQRKATTKPRSRFTPCNLVSRAQARAYLRTAVDDPVEAPLGPTCVYRSSNGRSHVTLAVTNQRFSQAVAELDGAAALRVAHRRAACGRVGGPKLYVSLTGGRVLAVEGPCVTALKFATAAVGRLQG